MIRTVTRCAHCGSVDFGGLVMDRRRIAWRGRALVAGGEANAAGVWHLARAIELLSLLAAADGRMVRTERLVLDLWPGAYGPPLSADNAIKIYVSMGRKALRHIGAPIELETIWGKGYRLVAREEAEACRA